MADKSVTQDYFFNLLNVNFEQGTFTWKVRDLSMFKTERAMNAWNNKNANKPALNNKHISGYKCGFIERVPYLAHRVIWFMKHNEWPEEIDHINGNRSDNRIVNLRDVNHKQNLRNQRLRKNNTSGHNGVYWFQRDQKWMVLIKVDGVSKFGGYFENIEDAISKRKQLDVEYGYHNNHGKEFPCYQ